MSHLSRTLRFETQSNFVQYVVLVSSLIVLAAARDVIAGHSSRPTAPPERQRMPVVNVRKGSDNFGPNGDTAEGKVRKKRAWIFPGTLWCGTGSRAIGYEQLGMFESTDKCCRQHDHCQHIIHSFTFKYGVFNTNFYTVSHCDCDKRFQQCLLSVNDTISRMVGYSFFNILRVPCFELTQQNRCTEMYWWGMCKVAKEAPYAIFKNSLPFNSSVTANNSVENANMSTTKGQNVTENQLVSPNVKLPKGERRCGSKDPLRGDAFLRKRTKSKGCKSRQKPFTVSSTTLSSISMTNTTLPSVVMPASTVQKILSATLDQKTHLSNVSKSNGSILERKRLGINKGTRKNHLSYSTPRKEVPSQVTKMSDLQTASRTERIPSISQAPTAVTTVKKTTKSHKDIQKRLRCGSRMSVRGDTFQPRHENCPEDTTPRPATVASSTAIKTTTAQTHQISRTTDLPRHQTMKTLWNTSTTVLTIASTQKTVLPTQAAVPRHDDEPQKQKNPFAPWNNSSQEITGNELLCGSLRYLDDCKYKIPPFSKKYNLHNMDSKTAYHCNCTNRLALQIESFKTSNILPFLLRDFVSQYCFKMPKEKKRCNKKSCSGGFAKASDLLQALKSIEEKDAEQQNSVVDRRRGIPIRLFKRCLRIVDPQRN